MSDLIERLLGPGHNDLSAEAAEELESLTADLDKCREGSAIRTRINDKQVARIKLLEDVLESAKDQQRIDARFISLNLENAIAAADKDNDGA